jgi:hypothetical protein
MDNKYEETVGKARETISDTHRDLYEEIFAVNMNHWAMFKVCDKGTELWRWVRW